MAVKIVYEVVDTEYGMLVDSFSGNEITEKQACEKTQEMVNHEAEKCSYNLYRVIREKASNGDWNYVDDELIGRFYN